MVSKSTDKETHLNTRNELEVFSNFLKKKGLKITAQRILVAEKIFSVHQHFTADSLLELLRDRRDEISKATIYRILSLMVEADLLIEHNFGEDFKYYEHILGHEHHDHIICNQCKRVIEFTNEKIEHIQSKIAEEHGFSITGHTLTIRADCNQKTNCDHLKKKS